MALYSWQQRTIITKTFHHLNLNYFIYRLSMASQFRVLRQVLASKLAGQTILFHSFIHHTPACVCDGVHFHFYWIELAVYGLLKCIETTGFSLFNHYSYVTSFSKINNSCTQPAIEKVKISLDQTLFLGFVFSWSVSSQTLLLFTIQLRNFAPIFHYQTPFDISFNSYSTWR